jgi:hypothetical protein
VIAWRYPGWAIIAEGGVADLIERFGGSDLEDAYVEAMR